MLRAHRRVRVMALRDTGGGCLARHGSEHAFDRIQRRERAGSGQAPRKLVMRQTGRLAPATCRDCPAHRPGGVLVVDIGRAQAGCRARPVPVVRLADCTVGDVIQVTITRALHCASVLELLKRELFDSLHQSVAGDPVRRDHRDERQAREPGQPGQCLTRRSSWARRTKAEKVLAVWLACATFWSPSWVRS